MTRLAELGRIVASEQDRTRAQGPPDEAAVQHFVQGMRRERRTLGKRWVAAAIVTVAAACVLGVVAWRRHLLTLAQSGAPAVGQPLVARPGETVPLNFPDGSQVVLASGTEAVVRELHDVGAALEVTRGQAFVAVRQQPGTQWLVGAGPYRVRVTGTRFSVDWAPGPKRFELRLTQGSVVVSSESGSHAAVTMVAPQSLVIDAGGWQLSRGETASNDAATAPEPTASAEPSATPPTPETAPDASASSAAPASTAALSAPTWEELIRRGKYAQAYEEAARHGVAQLADSRPSGALLSLAEACRFSGHGGEATQVLERLRARFPGSDDAATAAFQLGRLGGSAKWFRQYLKERPNGSLAREASGRLLEALDHSGERAAVRQAAEAYLARYPGGPHAAFARQLLGK